MNTSKLENLLPFGLLGFVVTLLIYVFGPFEQLDTLNKTLFFIALAVPVIIIVLYLWISRKKQIKINKEKQEEIEELNAREKELKEEKTEKFKIKYADQIPSIVLAISNFVNEDEKKKFIVSTNNLLNQVANVFKEIKGIDCFLTMKIFTQNDVVIKTLSRSTSSGRTPREKYIKEGDYSSADDFIRANTDIYKIAKAKKNSLKGRNLYFFSNDLVHYSGYKHPLLDRKDDDGKDYHDKINEFEGSEDEKEELRQKIWPLPYKSTMNFPICYMQQRLDAKDHAVIGTLCIDANSTDVFNKDLDKSIIQSVAETIYINYISAIRSDENILN